MDASVERDASNKETQRSGGESVELLGDDEGLAKVGEAINICGNVGEMRTDGRIRHQSALQRPY